MTAATAAAAAGCHAAALGAAAALKLRTPEFSPDR